MSCRRPSNASSRVSGPWGPISARLASTSTMGRRRRAAAVGFYLVENLSTLLAPADQPGLFEHDQVLGDRLAGEGHVAGQPAGADLTVAHEEVEHPATRRVADGRPQLVIGLRRHPD